MATEKLVIATANQTQDYLDQLIKEKREIEDISLRKAISKECIKVIEKGSIDFSPLWNLVHSPDLEWQSVTLFHYVGHSSAQGLLASGDSQQPPSLINKEALTSLFTYPNKLRLVFINSCCSRELADLIRQAGVPYVIGTTAKIKDDQAVQVARIFYQLLGDTHNPATIEKAFDETEIFIKNDSRNPALQQVFQQGGAMRSAFDTTVDEADSQAIPWQLYKRTDLTDEQRNWRLIPPVVYEPTEVNERYVVTSSLSANLSFSIFLSHTMPDQPVSKQLVSQIKSTFREYTVDPVWNDSTLNNPDERVRQLTDAIQQADFIISFINDAYITSSVLQQVMIRVKARSELGNMITRPIALLTTDIDRQHLPAKLFSEIRLPDDSPKTALANLCGNLFSLWNDHVRALKKNQASAPR
ncbi:hypothetical protein [Spirosoma aerophilum]